MKTPPLLALATTVAALITHREDRADGPLCHACRVPLEEPTAEFGGYVLHEACAAERREKAGGRR